MVAIESTQSREQRTDRGTEEGGRLPARERRLPRIFPSQYSGHAVRERKRKRIAAESAVQSL